MSYDFDLFVIGAGSGGVRAARFAAGFGARVAVAESRYYGGTCVNVGCVPKKLFAYAAQTAEDLEHAAGYGWRTGEATFDWPTLLANKNREIARLAAIYRKLLLDQDVRLFDGHASLHDEHTVEIDGQRHTAATILLATGSWPTLPDIPGAQHAITSNDAFFLERLPRRVVVVGGGYIAVEFASIFSGMGAQVDLLYRGELFLRGFDRDVRAHLRDTLSAKGIVLHFHAEPARIDRQDDGSLHVTLKNGQMLETDAVFCATGRRPMLDDLGSLARELKRDERGFLAVDTHYRTSVPSIRAVGDLIGTAHGRLPLTPVATAEGMAVARSLYRPEEFRELDYRLIPTAVFTQPNIGSVGLTEEEARDAGHELKIFDARFRALKLSLTDDPERTLMKLVVDARDDRVLGCHMVGPEAGEIIQGLAVALKAGATKQVFDDTLGIHPTAAEEFVTMRSPRK